MFVLFSSKFYGAYTEIEWIGRDFSGPRLDCTGFLPDLDLRLMNSGRWVESLNPIESLGCVWDLLVCAVQTVRRVARAGRPVSSTEAKSDEQPEAKRQKTKPNKR